MSSGSGLPASLGLLRLEVARRFEAAGIAAATIDAEILVAEYTNTGRLDAVLDPNKLVADSDLKALDVAIARRLAGEPVYRIIGAREFYGLPLRLSKDTLEPRPDTEILVDAALPFVGGRVAVAGSCRILDLGTGTGAIALALVHEVPGATAIGVDISDNALATAWANAEANSLTGRFTAQQSNWFDAVAGQFDLIVSNPPYIPSADIEGLAREVRDFDPRAALDGGPDGLEPYRIIAESASKYLLDGGRVAVEIGYDQRLAVAEIFACNGFAVEAFHRDYGGNDRVILFQTG